MPPPPPGRGVPQVPRCHRVRGAREKQLCREVHQSSGELEAAIYRYLDVTNEVPNEVPKPFVWTKTADQILASVARFVPTHFRYKRLILQRRLA